MGDLSLFHSFCIDTFENVLAKKKDYQKGLENPIFKYALKGGVIGQYAETYCINGEEMKFWAVNYHSAKNRDLDAWRVLLASEKAIKGIEAIKNGKKPNSKSDNPDSPYYEHIEPKSRVYEKLLGLENPNRENITKAFHYCKLVLITREEKDFLDSCNHNLFRKEDEDILNSWRASKYISDELYKESIDSIKDSGGKYLSAKDHGTAYARIAHLMAKGVNFEWRCDPNPNNAKDQGELISRYLENDNRNYSL